MQARFYADEAQGLFFDRAIFDRHHHDIEGRPLLVCVCDQVYEGMVLRALNGEGSLLDSVIEQADEFEVD